MRQPSRLSSLALCLFVLGCAGAPGGDDDQDSAAESTAVTTGFQNGVAPSSSYAGASDAILEQASANTNFNSATTLVADRDYPDGTKNSAETVLRFDLSSIPAGSTVQSVSLAVTVTNHTSGIGYSLYALTRAWAPAQVTWNAAESGSAWQSAGARGTGDRGASALATLTAPALGASTVSFSAAGVAAVQSWVKNPGANFGMVLDSVSDTDGLGFDSSEFSTASARPRLNVTYVPPATTTPPPATDAGTPGTPGTSPIAGLDESGKTIPDTNYAIPSGAIFMSPSGNDGAAGSQSAPVKSLSRALALVPAGGTVVARGGLYRDGSTASVSKVFTLQAYPHEQPWFDGTDVVTGWASAGSGRYSLSWSTPSFCGGHYYDRAYNQQTSAGPCAWADEYNDSQNPAAGDPQMVFLDGAYVHEVTTLAACTGTTFFYDQSAKKLYLGFNPSGHTVELASRPNALVLQGGAGGQVIRGIGFKRYASSEFASYATHAAVSIGVPNAKLENDVFSLMAAHGLAFGNPTGAHVNRVVFAKNGANGLTANGHQHSGTQVDGLIVESSIFNGNNTERFGVGCSASCNAAGSKMSHMNGVTIKNNVFENSVVAKGFWCDLACSNGVITGNVFRDNGDTGLMYEVSNTGILASNLIYGNGGFGIKCGSANTKIYNNTIVGNGTAVTIYDDQRSYGIGGWTDVGPDTVNVDFSNNVLASNTNTLQTLRTSTSSPNTGPNTFFSGFDYNAYFRPNDTPSVLVRWNDGAVTNYVSCIALHSGHAWESHCEDITSGADPFFVNAAAHDYRIRTNSVAYHSGKNLPADVAAALGLSTSTTVSRGAINWVGQ